MATSCRTATPCHIVDTSSEDKAASPMQEIQHTRPSEPHSAPCKKLKGLRFVKGKGPGKVAKAPSTPAQMSPFKIRLLRAETMPQSASKAQRKSATPNASSDEDPDSQKQTDINDSDGDGDGDDLSAGTAPSIHVHFCEFPTMVLWCSLYVFPLRLFL